MVHLVIGGASSGKSEAAENFCLCLGGRAAYVATMHPFGETARRRIDRHLSLRKGKGLATVEQYRDIGILAGRSGDYDVLLIECMTNLVANELFLPGGMADMDVAKKVADETDALAAVFPHLVIVTCDVFCDGVAYADETVRYMQTLADLNLRLTVRADRVTEVYYGIQKDWKSAHKGMKV